MPLRPTAFFYLGLLPVIILLWAWADSTGYNTLWTRKPDAQRTQIIGISQSRIRFGIITRISEPGSAFASPGPRTGRVTRLSYPRASRPLIQRIFPPLERENGGRGGFTDYHFAFLHLPFWFLLACYLPPWLALSYLLARRKRNRLISALPQPQAHSD